MRIKNAANSNKITTIDLTLTYIYIYITYMSRCPSLYKRNNCSLLDKYCVYIFIRITVLFLSDFVKKKKFRF
jgi:hypothetical protein